MDIIDKQTISKRFNDAAYDLALASIAQRNSNNDDFIKHTRDAGEALSQAIELALKYHLSNVLSIQEKKHFPHKPNIRELLEKYIDENGNEGDYFHHTVDDTIIPNVNFIFLKQNKNAITNSAKHSGTEPDFEIQKKYLDEIRKFITQYIEPTASLKTIQDYENIDSSSWDLFYAACDKFDKNERNYILIIGPNSTVDPNYLASLSVFKWDLIIDFDYCSEDTGFFKNSYSNMEVPAHKIKASDIIDSNVFSRFSQSHYHYFANSYKGSGDVLIEDYPSWNRRYAKNIELFLKSYSSVFLNQKTIIVNLYNSRRHINFFTEKIEQYFGTNCSFVFANDLKAELAQICEDVKGTNINITIPEIAEGFSNFSSNFGTILTDHGVYHVPFLASSETKDVTGVLPLDLFAKYEEDFEVVHKELPLSSDKTQDRLGFLRGESPISWHGIKERYDAEREGFNKKYVKPIEKLIENGRGIIYLHHEAGYGGTTIARRIAWEIHNDNPTLILKRYRERIVKEKIIDLHQRTRKAILVIVEVPQAITLDEVDILYKSIPASRPIVFLVVKRGKPTSSSNELAVTDWGNDTPALVNAYLPYISEYNNTNIENRKRNVLEKLIFSEVSQEKTPFYVGLITFEENFIAIKEYVKNFILEVKDKEEQKKVLAYLSIINDYLGQGLPAIFFKNLFKIVKEGPKDIFNLENYFNKDSSIVGALLSSYYEGNYKFWKIRHAFIAKEIKKQILSGMSENPEIWKQSLAAYCVKFIEDSVGDGTMMEYTEEILQKLFIGNKRDRAGEDFTNIISDIHSIEEKEQVFLTLKNSFSENPHYCSHLARFYAYNNKNWAKALKYSDEAIRLSEANGIADPLLYHIKGMCLRSKAYETMDQHRKLKAEGKMLDSTAIDEVIFQDVPNAALQFEISRKKSKEQNRVDEYGYIAHIQLLIHAIDYAIFISGKPKSNFLAENKDPFSDWMDLAESLLEDVKRFSQDDDESGKIRDCENDIEELYENYDLILQNLRNQLEKSKNPGRTRRQIVRAYIRKGSDFSKESKVVNNILELMEQNIENEPDNERNFYLWFQAARHSKIKVEDVIVKLSKWKANSNSIDATYYFYIIKVFRALEGYSDALIDAFNLIKECKAKGKTNITTYEWYGKGSELYKLISRNTLTPENKSEQLQLVEGYFTEYIHDGSGIITIENKLEVFFSPTQAKLTSSDKNSKVQFYLGFSYDGLRADSHSVRIFGQEPRNKEINSKIDNISKSEERVISVSEEKSANSNLKLEQKTGTKQRRYKGKIIDLQKPPVYVMGFVQTDLGKKYFFHKNNENIDVFSKLEIGTPVTFEIRENDKKWLAFNLEIVDYIE